MDNGGKGCGTETREYNQAYGKLCTSQREGYKLIGWFTEKEGGSKVDSETKMEAKDTQIYAHWKVNTHTVTIATNNSSYGTVDKTTLTIPHGTTYSASRNTLNFSNGQQVTASLKSLTGYTTTFSSWSQTSGTITDNTTITANFSRSANTYSITYNANGGTNAPDTQSFIYNSDAKISTQKPTRTGYTFQKWTYKGNNFNPGDAVPQNWTDFTLTANWTANKYTISYNNNGGSGCEEETKKIPYGTEYGKLCEPTNENFYFDGWYTKKSKGSKVDAKTKMGDKNVTIYAHWTANGTWYFCRNGNTCHNSKPNTALIYCEKTTPSNINNPAAIIIKGYTYAKDGDLYYIDQNTRYILAGCLRKTKSIKNDCTTTCKG